MTAIPATSSTRAGADESVPMPDARSLEHAVARFVVDFGWDDIDDLSRQRVRTLVQDQFALQVGCSQLPWSRQVRAFLRHPRPGRSTVAADVQQMDAADAAYLNACYGHGFEYDDVAGNAHPGCCVVPVAFAVGEEVGASLREVALALVTGYEVYTRLGRLGSPALLNNGWQPHSVLANFGAAAAAAKLLRLDLARTHHALSIAMSHCSGTTEYTSTGGSVKRVHAGIAARNGIESAHLARAGIMGPRRYLTGNKGFYRTFVRSTVGADAAGDFAGGTPLLLERMWVKAYCCCGANHAYIDAMATLRDRVADIDHVDTEIQTMTDACVGLRNEQAWSPRNIEELQYALPVQMAMAALGVGNGYAAHRAFLDGRLVLDESSDVIRLARRIRLRVAPELDDRYFVASLTVHFRDGSSRHLYLDRAKGMPSHPFTAEELRGKFDELTRGVLDPDQAARLFAAVNGLDWQRPAVELTALLRGR